MFNDNTNFKQEDKENMSIQMLSEDGHNVHMIGQITDKIYKNGKLVQVIEGHNLVVNSFLKLVMALCKGQAGYAGLQYWAVGSGHGTHQCLIRRLMQVDLQQRLVVYQFQHQRLLSLMRICQYRLFRLIFCRLSTHLDHLIVMVNGESLVCLVAMRQDLPTQELW